MRKQRPLVAVVKEQPDYEKDLSKKRLTDQEIRDNLPAVWKDRIVRQQIAVPIKGSSHYV